MKITVLSDNIGQGTLKGEWGLSLYIEFEDKSYLLDTGASDRFIVNAEKLGIDLSKVSCLVLSHAHYDHTQGLVPFFEINANAPVYLSPNAGENCYGGWRCLSKYIGMPKGVLAAYPSRFLRPSGVVMIAADVAIVPHSTPGLGRLGYRNHLYIKKGWRYLPDDFSHEQTLVFRTADGLVLMNSCSHCGPEVVISEVQRAFPGERIAAYLGGLHLFRLSDREVEAVGDKLSESGITEIYTGHCTGERAYGLLKKRFGNDISQFCCGMRIEL